MAPQRPKRIMVFGETGVGKSSIINMLAGRDITKSSNNAIGCTFENYKYQLEVNGQSIEIYDTTGLNESIHGKVPALRAIAGLFRIIRELAKTDGIDFLIFVARPRITENTSRNYELFHKAFCQGRVPVVIVVTGLEHEDPMEAWWGRNEPMFRDHGMVFDGYACVTAIKGKKLPSGAHSLQQEYDSSRKALRSAISPLCQRNEPWKDDHDAWFQFTLGYLLNTLTVFLDASEATRQKMITQALVEHVGLGKGKAKRVVAKISSSLKTGLA